MLQLLTSLIDFPARFRRGAVSVGNFDGVHRGHAQLIGELVSKANQLDGPALVMTFDPPPIAILYPDRKCAPPLTTLERRAELLHALGVDALIAIPTTPELLLLSAEDFFQHTILGVLEARAMVEGPNFCFGHRRQGDVTLLESLCSAANLDFSIAAAREDSLGLISSTRIRQYLNAGDVAAANRLLTQTYSFDGTVVAGARRGRELGYPTANLEQIASLLPGPGVYVGQVQFMDSTIGGDDGAIAAINIGPNPTFEESRPKVEVHIVDFAGGSLYGNRLRIRLLEKIRDIQKFNSLEDLREQIGRDVAACLKIGSSVVSK